MIWSENFASVISQAYHSRHNSQEKAKTHAHALGQNRARGKQGALWAILSPGRVLLGGDVPPRSPNSDPISTKKCQFPHPFSDLEEVTKRNNLHVCIKQKLCHHC